jgi:FkbM family methyltransferase
MSVKGLIRRLLPRAIRPRRIVAGPLRGTWMVTSWHDYPAGLTGRTERPLLEWFAGHAAAGETWLDIGAHYGYTAFALAKLVGSTGRVFTFEPVPATAGCVDQGRTLNGLQQVTVLPFGLGAADTLDTRRLAISRGMADSTLQQDAGAWTVTVAIARFDWLWPLVCGGDQAIHGVKIDVQGMELEVLEGMRESLRRWRPRLVVELHTGVSREQVRTLLRDVGYADDASPIERPSAGGPTRQLLDNESYAFHPA